GQEMSIDDLNELVPELTLIFQRLIALRREIIIRAHELEQLGHDPARAKRIALPPEIAERRERLEAAVADFERLVDRVGTLGGILSDLDLGIVDFHHVLDGNEVFLSWQFGEPVVSHYRPADAKLDARRRLPSAPPPAPKH